MTDLQQAVARAMSARAKRPFYNIPSLERVLVGSLGDAWDCLAQSAIETTIRGLIADGASEAMVIAYNAALKTHIESVPAEERPKRWRIRKTGIGGWRISPQEKAAWRYRAMLLAKARELGINVEGMG